MSRSFLRLTLIGIAAFGLSHMLAKSIAPYNLVDITQKSMQIFEGRCIKIQFTTVKSRDGKTDIPTVAYTFEVLDNLKGAKEKTITIKQLGHAQPGQPEFSINPDWIGMPTYEAGQTYLLFMNKTFSTGLTSPCGVEQGIFRLKDGKAFNLIGNPHILHGMSNNLKARGYSDLVGAVAQGPSASLKTTRLKTLVREMLTGKFRAPTRGELNK